jgi:hypothetical protein
MAGTSPAMTRRAIQIREKRTIVAIKPRGLKDRAPVLAFARFTSSKRKIRT